ncbi:MAG TPA: NAD(P)H-dependent oxidoreductase subunit E [Pirellulaceae bacterium]|nr:NAD(P)H-dependent oxidoreductase subunit E [Pirellulaceae bacterium]
MATQRILTDEMIQAINAYIPRYPSKQAVTLPALHIVNEKLKHVPLQAVVEIAEILGLHPSQVQDTLTFYGYFKQAGPHGNSRVWICRSISCALRGGEELLDHVCLAVGVKPGETTPDGKLTVEYAECLGACEHAPCMLADATLHKSVTHKQADEFLKGLK